MIRGPGRSVRSRLMLVVLATTLAALGVVAIALVVYESRTYERSAAASLMTQAQVLGRATAAALVFDDPDAARDNLAALKLQPQIRAAAIYTTTGRLFASYGAPGAFGAGSPRQPQAVKRLGTGHLMDEMAVNVEQRLAGGERLHRVRVPDLLV